MVRRFRTKVFPWKTRSFHGIYSGRTNRTRFCCSKSATENYFWFTPCIYSIIFCLSSEIVYTCGITTAYKRIFITLSLLLFVAGKNYICMMYPCDLRLLYACCRLVKWSFTQKKINKITPPNHRKMRVKWLSNTLSHRLARLYK